MREVEYEGESITYKYDFDRVDGELRITESFSCNAFPTGVCRYTVHLTDEAVDKLIQYLRVNYPHKLK
jgi:hypothetical protein